MPCIKTFVQGPETYLTALGTELSCALRDGEAAVLDAAHRSYVNYEIFFFSEEAARAEFERDPARHCGVLTDPVSRQRFRPSQSSPRLEHEGRPYFFFTEETKIEFAAKPEMYALPDYKMLPVDSLGTPGA